MFAWNWAFEVAIRLLNESPVLSEWEGVRLCATNLLPVSLRGYTGRQADTTGRTTHSEFATKSRKLNLQISEACVHVRSVADVEVH